MALPAGVTTATVTAGVPVTHTGGAVKAFLSIEPSVFLVHTATGTPLVDFLEELTIAEGVAGQFTLPHTDQAGFQDENGNAYTNWYYTARISYSTPSKAKTKAPKIKVFQLATGQTIVDLDALPGGAPALPYTAPIATVTSVGGLTGPVSGSQIAALPDFAATYATIGSVAGKLDTVTAAAVYGKKDRNSFVTLGDSRTQANGNIREEDVSVGGTALTKLDTGYATWAMILLRQRMRWLKNGGVGGDTVAQMLARTDGLLAFNPGWLIGFGVINSINSDVSSATIISELDQIFDKCEASGVKVVWGTDWCSLSTNTTARKTALYATNEWLRQQVGVRPDFYLADYASAIVEPGTGMPYTSLASDNLHQDGPGGLRMGRQLVKVLQPLVPPSDRLIASNLDTTNLLLNGMFEGDAGAGRATSWASGTGGTATYAKVARTDGVPGTWQQVTLTGATASRLREDLLPAVPGSWVEGDKVFFEIEFETDAVGWAATQFYAGIQVFGVAGLAHATDGVHTTGTPNQTDRPESGIFRTGAITIQPGATSVRVYVTLLGDGTYRVARARLVKVN